MANRKIFSTFLGLLLIAGATVSHAEEVLKAAKEDYQVQPGDVLSISAWHEPDLQREVLVRPDGYFSFPLVGEVNAKNKTIYGIRQLLMTKLVKLIPDIDLTVSVKQLLGNRIYVIGKVRKPGEYIVSRNVDVMQALSMAAGTDRFAQVDEIRVLRRLGQGQIVIPFNYSEVEEGIRLEQNILLRSGDVVVVP